MRSVFRFLGGLRFVFGAAIVAIALLFQSNLGEIWTGALVLAGVAIAVSGMVTIFLMVVYFAVMPFVFLGITWFLADFWDGYTYMDHVRANPWAIYFMWASGLFSLPLTLWSLNRSWFFMVQNFAVDDEPTDTAVPELHAWGSINITGDPYLAAVTITEQGLIIDRRNFSAVILPWKWIKSIQPVPEEKLPTARVAMQNGSNEFLTIDIPWNPDLMELKPGELPGGLQ